MTLNFVLTTPNVRANVVRCIALAPDMTRVEIREPKRTLPQNARFWAMLTDLSQQARPRGEFYTPEQWKVLVLHACGHEADFVRALDGATFVPFGLSSSKLSKAQMADVMEWMEAYGAENGVTFHDGERDAA